MSSIGNMKNTIFVTVGGKGGSIGLSLDKSHGATSTRLKSEALMVYADPTVSKAVGELKDWLEGASRKAAVKVDLNGMYAIPASMVNELNQKIESVETSFDADGQFIQDNYDAVKAANRKDVEKAIENFPAKEKANILGQFERLFPTPDAIKNMRRLNITVLTSPFAGEIAGLDVLADRAADAAQDAYKRAVFSELAPVYEALATYYTKTCNGMDVGMKSQNFFIGQLLPDLKENNEIRRDGFTANVVKVLEKEGNRIFEDGMLCYNLILNILNEAKQLGVEGVLPSLDKAEARALKLATAPTYVLGAATLKSDIECRTPIEAMLGIEE